MSSKDLINAEILRVIHELTKQGIAEVSSTQLLSLVNGSSATLKRHLEDLVASGKINRTGKARSTRYHLAKGTTTSAPASTLTIPLSPKARILLATLSKPLATRTPVTYQRKLIDQYVPNQTFLLPKDLAETLAREGRMSGQQPAGTYIRKVLEQLLIDLSWSSSQLEGNRYTLLATEELFKRGAEGGDADAIMLLNHKRGIEFLVDAVPEYGLTIPLIRNLHSLLMQDLLNDPKALGEIRNKIVNISDTVYVPSQVSSLLEEMLNRMVETAKQIKNPIEAAFFLWVNIAYLQPFEGGNKRTSRLAANIPLMLYNCAPLSFMNIDARDYACAMMGIYEFLDASLAADLFAWTYRRSIQKYAVVLESMGAPDQFRLKYREILTSAVQQVLCDRKLVVKIVRSLHLPANDKEKFMEILESELENLTVHNCARHRVTMKMVEEWIKKGRPK